MQHTGATRAAIYARISTVKEADNEGLAVERQVRDSLDLCERRGWIVAEDYRDESVSAYTGEARPEYERMLADARTGRIDAIVSYRTDRLTRHPIELEEIIQLHEQYGIELDTVSGPINLGTAEGRMAARFAAAVARAEVERMSERIKREILQRAERGLPHGQKAYGWDRVDGEDVLNEAEAAVIREIAERLLSGESVKAVTESLNERGIPPPYGHRPSKDGRPREWSRVTVRAVVLRERNAGLRRHQGKIIGRAAWKPIFDEDTFYRLHALLSDPARKVTTGSAYRYLLTGIAKCGKCEAPVRLILGPRTRNGKREKRRSYVCSRCHGISRDQGCVDRLIERLTIEFLASPKAKAVFSPEPDALKIAEANRLQAKLDDAARRFAKDLITGDQLTIITSTVRPKLRALEAETRPAPIDLSDLATPDIAKRWKGIPLERRRAVVNFLWDIKLLPRGKNASRRFDPESVQALPRWKQAKPEPPASGARTD